MTLEEIEFVYEKQNTYKDVLYLHGWETVPWTAGGKRWINGSLRRYDQVLPELRPGQTLKCQAEFVSGAAPGTRGFVTYYIYSIAIDQAQQSEEGDQ